MKILSIFLVYLFSKINTHDCGCSKVEGQHLQWNYFYIPFYHYFITKQIVDYYKDWADAIMEHEISYNGSRVLKTLEVTQIKELKCDAQEVKHYDKAAPNYEDDYKPTKEPTKNMLDIIDKLINIDKVKGLREFQGIFQQFDEIKTVDYPDGAKLDFDWVSQKFIDFKYYHKCARGFSECSKDNEKKIKTFFFFMKVNLSFEGDSENQKRGFFIVNRLIPLYAKGNLTYKFQPFFYQHTCQDSGIEGRSVQMPTLNQFLGTTGHLLTSQVQDSIQLYSDPTNISYPNDAQQDVFINKPITLNYFGHHDRPGVSEYRTSCIHALASLRRAIELYIKVWFDPTYIIDYCPPPTVTYERPNQKNFLNKPWLWLIQMYGRKMPKIEKKEVIKEEPKIIIEKPPKVEKITLPKEEDKMPKFLPIWNEPKIQNIPPKESKKYLIYFLCQEFMYAIQGKLLEEKYQDKLFETGYIKIECGFQQPKEFNPSQIWAPEEIQQEEYVSRGYIYYFEEEIGFFEFSRKKKEGDYAIMNLCFEAEVKFYTFFLTKQNCIEERIFKTESLQEGFEEATVFSYHFGQTILKFRRMIDEIYLISLGKLRYRDIIEIGKEAFNIEQKDGVNTGQFIFSYGICTEEQPYFEYFDDTNSLNGERGLILTGYYQNLPHAPIQMIIQQSGEFHFTIELDTGLQKAKFYYPSLLRLNREQADQLQETLKDELEKLNEKLQKDDLSKKKIAELLDIAKINIRKQYLAKLYKEEHLEELQQFITNTIYRKNGLVQYLASTAFLKQQGKPTVIGEVNDAIQNGELGQYFDTNIMNITIYAALTNAIFTSLNYKRIDIDQNSFQLVTTQLPLNQIPLADIEGLEDADKNENIKIHYEKQCKKLTEIQFSKEYFSDYELKNFGDWVFKQKDKSLNKHVKNFLDDVEAKFLETDNIYSVEQIDSIIKYDLNLGTFLYNSKKNNFFSFVYGNEEYSSKFVVNLYQFSYHLSNTYYIYFKTFYFSSQYLLTFANQFEFVNGLIHIINEVDNHFRLVVHKAMTTAFNCEKISIEDIEKIIDEVLQDLSTQQLVPNTICKTKEGLIDNEFLIIQLNPQKLQEIGPYDFNAICEQDPDLQQIMKFTELSDSYKIEVTELKALQNVKDQIQQNRPARQYHSTYEFLQKNGYDYKPVLYRQLHSYFKHLFAGEFSNEIKDQLNLKNQTVNNNLNERQIIFTIFFLFNKYSWQTKKNES